MRANEKIDQVGSHALGHILFDSTFPPFWVPICVSLARFPAVRRLIHHLWPYFAVAFLYLCTSPYHRGLNNPNEMVRVYMTKALVDDGTPAIDSVIRQWGGVDDKAIRDGKLYSSKAPLQSLTGVPVYALLPDTIKDKRIVTTCLLYTSPSPRDS